MVNGCPLCGRELVEGLSTDRHHLIPRGKGGAKGPTVLLHKVCHRFIHATFTEAELARLYHTIPLLLQHPDVQRFAAWVAKKPLEFCDSHREQNTKKKKRRR